MIKHQQPDFIAFCVAFTLEYPYIVNTIRYCNNRIRINISYNCISVIVCFVLARSTNSKKEQYYSNNSKDNNLCVVSYSSVCVVSYFVIMFHCVVSFHCVCSVCVCSLFLTVCIVSLLLLFVNTFIYYCVVVLVVMRSPACWPALTRLCEVSNLPTAHPLNS